MLWDLLTPRSYLFVRSEKNPTNKETRVGRSPVRLSFAPPASPEFPDVLYNPDPGSTSKSTGHSCTTDEGVEHIDPTSSSPLPPWKFHPGQKWSGVKGL